MLQERSSVVLFIGVLGWHGQTCLSVFNLIIFQGAEGMPMDNLIAFVRLEVLCFLIGLLVIVAYKILTGEINFRGVLSEKITAKKTKGYSTVRVQLMFFVLMSAFYYVSQVAGNPKEFPQVPDELLLALGGSHAVYLMGKSYSSLSFNSKGKKGA